MKSCVYVRSNIWKVDETGAINLPCCAVWLVHAAFALLGKISRKKHSTPMQHCGDDEPG